MKHILLLLSTLSLSVFATTHLIKVDEFTLEYEIAGNGKHTVFLEAGANANLSDWHTVFDSIAKLARVIRYSRVGEGQSTKIKRHFTSTDYANYASELLTKLKITEPVILVAHSYGGNIARDFAAAYPEKIKALLMLDPSSEHDVDIVRTIDLEKGNKEIAQVKLADMANGMPNHYLDFWSKRPLPDYPQIKDIPVTVITSVKTVENPTNLFFTDQGRKMWGELWQNWANAFPQGKSVLTKKSGHFIQFEEPELVINELNLFINKLDKQD